MILWSIRQVFHVRSILLAQDSPRRLALGCALGMVLGLLPKGNLLAVGISTVILATRVNLGTAMLAAAVFSLVGAFLDPLTHPMGWSLLNWDTLEPTWTFLYGLPLAPWTSFNNTVVLGSLVAGLLMAYPTYWASYTVFDRWQEASARRSRSAANGPTSSAGARHQVAVAPAAVVSSTLTAAVETLPRMELGAVGIDVGKAQASAWGTTANVDRWCPPACVCTFARVEELRVTWSEDCRGATSGLSGHTLAGEPAPRLPRST